MPASTKRLPGFLALVLVGCSGSVDGPIAPCDLSYRLLGGLAIGRVDFPVPVLAGSSFLVHGEAFPTDDRCFAAEAVLRSGGGEGGRSVVVAAEVVDTNSLSFTLAPEAAEALGGTRALEEVEVRFVSRDGGPVFSARASIDGQLVEELTPAVRDLSPREVYLNDAVVLHGEGFIGGDEGRTEVVLSGSCAPDGGGAPRAVDGLVVEAAAVPDGGRARATLLWPAAACGFAPARFSGTLTPVNRHVSGRESAGSALAVEVSQQETTLMAIEPGVLSLGQVAEVTGRGFVGPDDGGTTGVRLRGSFTPHGGAMPETIDTELVGDFVDGSLLRYPITVSAGDGLLRATAFGAQRGTFEGEATPVVTAGETRREGRGAHVAITLGPVRQVVWVRFVAGFSESLALFGLEAAEPEIREAVARRMQEIYCPPDAPERCVNVELRTEEPEDFFEGGYSILDIGGRDPNGLGLLGYCGAAAKDVGNLRLHDHVGGENALGAVDGLAYGGVFIESFLFWSEHPGLGARPAAAPPPELRFDEIFDPVREREVIAGEWPTGAAPERAAQIQLAVEVLVSMVADSAAHELGHSLGLALPYGNPAEYHNQPPGDGCLMDSGPHRPFAERARLDGDPGGFFCDDSLAYLQSILPVH